ncbi:MAG: hypothetical protein WBM35_08935, partial [Candidatus Electrothrix sp.]
MTIEESQAGEFFTAEQREWLDRMFAQARDEDNRMFQRTSVLAAYLRQCTLAGYGGAVQIADIAFDIPALTYRTIPIDTLEPVVQRGVVIDLINDTIGFSFDGVWRFSVSFNIENIDEQNSSRTFNVRPYNVTQDVPGASIVVPVSRNQGDIYFVTTLILDNVIVGDDYRVEVGGVDAIAGGTLIEAQIQANNLTEI